MGYFPSQIDLKSKAVFSGGVTPFLLDSSKVDSALKQGSLKPAAELLLEFQLKIFLTQALKILLKILEHFLSFLFPSLLCAAEWELCRSWSPPHLLKITVSYGE